MATKGWRRFDVGQYTHPLFGFLTSSKNQAFLGTHGQGNVKMVTVVLVNDSHHTHTHVRVPAHLAKKPQIEIWTWICKKADNEKPRGNWHRKARRIAYTLCGEDDYNRETVKGDNRMPCGNYTPRARSAERESAKGHIEHYR